MTRSTIFVAAWFSLPVTIGVARADEIAQAAPPPVAAPAAPSVEHDDPGTDHALLGPTALTQPAGTVTLSLYEVFGAGLTYGITDRLQLSASGTILIDDNTRAWGTLKYQLLRADRTRLSLYGGLTYHQGYKPYDPAYPQKNIPGTDNREQERLASPLAGFALTECFNDDCHSSFTAAGAAVVNVRDKTSADWYLDASLLLRMSAHTKLLFELAGRFDQPNNQLGALQSYIPAVGLRMFWQHLSGDVGFLLWPEEKGTTVDAYFPVPYVSVSARY